MKVFVILFTIVVAAVALVSAGYGSAPNGGYGGAGGAGGSGGGSSFQAPPCPRNYLFSCQPSLSAAPCSAQSNGGSNGYGASGAYSEPVPSYANAPAGYQYAGYQYY